VSFRVIRGGRQAAFTPPGKAYLSLAEVTRYGCPQRGLPDEVNDFRRRNLVNLRRGLWTALLAHRLGIPALTGRLWGSVRRADGSVVDLGLMSQRVVTTAGVNFLVDAWQNLVELETMKYHALGTGSTAEAVGNTALVTELTTQYSVDNTRPTGTLAEGAAANVFRSVGTVTVDAAVAATEHGLLSAAAAGTGVLWDRSVFAVVNLGSGDSFEITYDATFAAGS